MIYLDILWEFEDPFPPAILALSLQYSSCEMAPLDKTRLGSWDPPIT